MLRMAVMACSAVPRQLAVQQVHRLLNQGYTEVVDADLSGYFDTIPHAELMQCVARRVSDKAMLHLVKMWLVAPVEEIDGRGHVHRTTRNKDEGQGSPQGSPISPLLANLYMRRFVVGWKTLGQHRTVQPTNSTQDHVHQIVGELGLASRRRARHAFDGRTDEHHPRVAGGRRRAADNRFLFIFRTG